MATRTHQARGARFKPTVGRHSSQSRASAIHARLGALPQIAAKSKYTGRLMQSPAPLNKETMIRSCRHSDFGAPATALRAGTRCFANVGPFALAASARRPVSHRVPLRGQRGFTLIEMMIVVVIVGTVAAIALPSYRDYVRRGKVSEVTSVLGDGRVKVEQFFLDNSTYVGSPCAASTKWFTVTCTNLSTTTYTLTATGISTTDMNGFVYTVDQANLRTTAGPFGSGNCWIFRKGDGC